MMQATLYVGLIFILSGFASFGWAYYVRERTGSSIAQTAIYTFLAFGMLALGVLLFSMGFFSGVYERTVNPVGDNPATQMQ